MNSNLAVIAFVMLALVIIGGGVYLMGSNKTTGHIVQEQQAPETKPVAQEQQDSEAKSGTPVQGRLMLEPRIEIVSAPMSVEAGDIFLVSWRVDSEAKTTPHMAVHYGRFSVPNPSGPDDYPSASVFLCSRQQCSLPGFFSVSLGIFDAGTYYFRAHAVIDGNNVWSEERTIEVSDTSANQPTPEVNQPMPSSTSYYDIEADDHGFYSADSSRISSLSVSRGSEAALKFAVRKENVYYGGLDFRGCGVLSNTTKPGDSIEVRFVPESDCDITSYWPLSGVKKSALHVSVA